MKRIIAWLRREVVLTAALALALVSMCAVPPDEGYWDYIDFRTLGILFCLMTVVAGFRGLGVFQVLSQKLLGRARDVRQLALLLLLLCFFSSMVITNDVALLTFVPFTFTLLEMAGGDIARNWRIPLVVMQTIAANLGSMLTPLGNPQNLYLYGKADMSLGGLVGLMLPYSGAALLLLCLWGFVRGHRQNAAISVHFSAPAQMRGGRLLGMYLALFAVSLLAVLRVLPYGIALAAVLLFVLLADRTVLREVDYSLLLTFVGFFVFVGNMGRIPAFRAFLERVVTGHEVLTAVLASQLISNVPAALLLSEFTENIPSLIVGTNLGGLGTLIASMASLISYQQFAQKHNGEKGAYLRYFTAANVAFLAVLAVLRAVLAR